MSNISTWSTTAASNNSASPDGFPEGMAPSGVNNAAREVMAAVRTQHEDAQWIDLGNTPTNTSSTTFTLVGDQTTQYHVGRRVKCTDASTLYGTITVSAFTSLTTVTVVLDSGVLSGSLTAAALGIIGAANSPLGNVTVDTLTVDKVISSAGNEVDSGLFVIKGSDESVDSGGTGSTLQDDDDLTLTLAASSTYEIELVLVVDSASATPDWKFHLVGADGTWGVNGTASTGSGSFEVISDSSDGVSDNITLNGTTPAYVTLKGVALSAGAGGIFKLQWAQNTSNGTATTVKTGSWMKATKLA